MLNALAQIFKNNFLPHKRSSLAIMIPTKNDTKTVTVGPPTVVNIPGQGSVRGIKAEDRSVVRFLKMFPTLSSLSVGAVQVQSSLGPAFEMQLAMGNMAFFFFFFFGQRVQSDHPLPHLN